MVEWLSAFLWKCHLVQLTFCCQFHYLLLYSVSIFHYVLVSMEGFLVLLGLLLVLAGIFIITATTYKRQQTISEQLSSSNYCCAVVMKPIHCVSSMIFGGVEKPWMSRWWVQGLHWVHLHPLQKFQKYDFIAIFEGFGLTLWMLLNWLWSMGIVRIFRTWTTNRVCDWQCSQRTIKELYLLMLWTNSTTQQIWLNLNIFGLVLIFEVA